MLFFCYTILTKVLLIQVLKSTHCEYMNSDFQSIQQCYFIINKVQLCGWKSVDPDQLIWIYTFSKERIKFRKKLSPFFWVRTCRRGANSHFPPKSLSFLLLIGWCQPLPVVPFNTARHHTSHRHCLYRYSIICHITHIWYSVILLIPTVLPILPRLCSFCSRLVIDNIFIVSRFFILILLRWFVVDDHHLGVSLTVPLVRLHKAYLGVWFGVPLLCLVGTVLGLTVDWVRCWQC